MAGTARGNGAATTPRLAAVGPPRARAAPSCPIPSHDPCLLLLGVQAGPLLQGRDEYRQGPVREVAGVADLVQVVCELGRGGSQIPGIKIGGLSRLLGGGSCKRLHNGMEEESQPQKRPACWRRRDRFRPAAASTLVGILRRLLDALSFRDFCPISTSRPPMALSGRLSRCFDADQPCLNDTFYADVQMLRPCTPQKRGLHTEPKGERGACHEGALKRTITSQRLAIVTIEKRHFARAITCIRFAIHLHLD
jgi:hypothetical protein